MKPLPVPPKLYFYVIGRGPKDRALGLRPERCLRAVGEACIVWVSFKWQLPSPPWCQTARPSRVVRPVRHSHVLLPVNTSTGVMSVIS